MKFFEAKEIFFFQEHVGVFEQLFETILLQCQEYIGGGKLENKITM